MTLLGVIGALTLVTTVAQFWPQPIRILRHGTAGVSSTTWGMLMVSVSGWSTYGILSGRSVVWVTNFLVVPGVLLVVTKTWVRASGDRKVILMSLIGSIVCVVLMVAVTGPVLVALSMWEVAALIPQTLDVMRARTQRSIEGVSLLGWCVTIAAQGLWGTWYIMTHGPLAPTIGAWLIVGLAAALVIKVATLRDQRWVKGTRFSRGNK